MGHVNIVKFISQRPVPRILFCDFWNQCTEIGLKKLVRYPGRCGCSIFYSAIFYWISFLITFHETSRNHSMSATRLEAPMTIIQCEYSRVGMWFVRYSRSFLHVKIYYTSTWITNKKIHAWVPLIYVKCNDDSWIKRNNYFISLDHQDTCSLLLTCAPLSMTISPTQLSFRLHDTTNFQMFPL